MSVRPYQITIFVCYADSKLLRNQIGLEMRINLDTRDDKQIIVKKCNTFPSEEDLMSLMHIALQLNDKDWFEELGERKKQFISL